MKRLPRRKDVTSPVLKEELNRAFSNLKRLIDEGGGGGSLPETLTINRTGDLITSVVSASKTITITRDIDGSIISVNDGTYTSTIVRAGVVVTGVTVT